MVFSSVSFTAFADDETGTTATEPATSWDGTTVSTAWYDGNENATEFTISTAADLAGLAKITNSEKDKFKGKTIKLEKDIDLGGKEWTPIGKVARYNSNGNPVKDSEDDIVGLFYGNFDGQGHTIKNLSITGYGSDVGLFGFTMTGEIKDFTLENASVSGYLDVGAVAGCPYTTEYTDITVKGSIQIDGYAYVGGAFGKNAYDDITNVNVMGDEGSYVKAESGGYRTYVGGLVGFMGEGNQTIKDCDVAIDVTGSTCDVGGITGMLHYGNSMIDCTYKGSLTLTSEDNEAVGEIGGLAGTYKTGSEEVKDQVTTVKGCTAIVDRAQITRYGDTEPTDVTDSITSLGTIYSEVDKTAGVYDISAEINGKQETSSNVAASIGSNYYKTLDDAVAALKSGDTLKLLNDVTVDTKIVFDDKVTLDLNGKNLTSEFFDADNKDRYAFVFEKGGKIIDSAEEKGEIVSTKSRTIYSSSSTDLLTVDGVNATIKAARIDGSVVIATTGGGLTLTNSVITTADENGYAVSSFGPADQEDIRDVYTIENTKIYSTYTCIYRNGSIGKFAMSVKGSELIAKSSGVNTNTTAVYISNQTKTDGSRHQVSFENCVITGDTGIEAKFSDITLKDCDVTATGTPAYSQNGSGATTNGFAVVISDNTIGQDVKPVGNIIIESGNYTGLIGLENFSDAKALMEADTKTDAKVSGGSFSTDVSAYCANGFKMRYVNGKYVVDKDESTDTISLAFEKQDGTDNVYDIVLSGDGKDIHRLNAAEFTFALDVTKGDLTYEIAAADKMSLITKANAENYYEFHFDGKDFTKGTADSGSTITIGTVTFDGYGEFTFGANEGKVTATTMDDNLVTEFVVNGGTGKGTLKIDSKLDTEITVPAQTLTINVAMNHKVTDNAADYQDMTVEISGGDLGKDTKEFKLGTDGVALANNGVYTISEKLTQNRLYTVTVKGAGYRTARYTVNMSADKTMNFWNNVMTSDVTVVDDTKATKNFLAGDIVKDGVINIYDLSAVVAYFGADELQTSNPAYAKYDINRDGKIDMMDISIVLTSWGE